MATRLVNGQRVNMSAAELTAFRAAQPGTPYDIEATAAAAKAHVDAVVSTDKRDILLAQVAFGALDSADLGAAAAGLTWITSVRAESLRAIAAEDQPSFPAAPADFIALVGQI